MSIACLEYLAEVDSDMPTTVSNDGLYYPHPTDDEFQIRLALDFSFLRRWLESYPGHCTEEFEKISRGEVHPNIGRVVEILELIEETIKAAHPNSPWIRYFRGVPSRDHAEHVWIYDENGADAVFAGSFVPTYDDPFGGLFYDKGGKWLYASHWALREPGEADAPSPPPDI